MTTEPALPLRPSAAASTVPLADLESSVTAAPAPRIRWAGIVWGVVIAALAAVALVTIAEGSRRAGINDWLRALDPATINPGWIVAIVVLTVGVVLLITGAVALLRRVQRRGAAS